MPRTHLQAESADLTQLIGNRHGMICPGDQTHLTDIGTRLRSLLKKGVLARLERGVYIPSLSLAGIEDWEHYRYRSLALGHHHGKILGGMSAAVVHGLWLVDSAPPKLEFYRPHGDRVGRGHGYRQLHGRISPQHVNEIAGIRVRRIARTIVDLGRYHGFSAAFVALSAALAHAKCDRSDVLRITEKLNLHGTKELPRIIERVAGNLGSALGAIFHAQVV